MRKFYTAEAVTEGHPDKLCDQIADTILDICGMSALRFLMQVNGMEYQPTLYGYYRP